MIKKLSASLWLAVCMFSFGTLMAQKVLPSSGKYHTNSEIQDLLKKFEQSNPALFKLHKIAVSPGGDPVSVLEIGNRSETVPAIFVGANFEGNYPLASSGALALAQMLADSAKYTKKLKWFVLVNPNPDAAKQFYSNIKYERTVNDFSINNDADDLTNEDGFDDLNSDGFITQMRVKDPEGTYIISKKDSRIMAKADPKKGERGEYKIFTEGLDNDCDGQYNEDGEGGINIGISFPHLFPKDKKEAGLWPGQSPEVFGIMKFIFENPNITMVYTLGSSNFCINPPKAGRKGDVNLESIKIPTRYATMFGVDPNKSFTMDEVIELMKSRVPAGMEVTPSLVAGFLGLGAVVNPIDDDLKIYTKLTDDYKKYLKAKKFNTEVLDYPADKDGSFELWAYYHLGLPSFSMNLFSIPKVKEAKKDEKDALSVSDVEKMSVDDFTALGEEKITAFIKVNNAPERFSAKGIIEMMKSGRFTPKQLVEMIKKIPKPEKPDELSEKEKALIEYSEKEYGGKGILQWQKVKHPDFGEIEVGGTIPFLENTPKPEKIDSLLNIQLPWLLKLSKNIPEIGISSEKISELGAGVYRIEIFVENKSFFPYPIAIGERNKQPAPVIIVIDGEFEILEGLKRTSLGTIGGNQVKKLSWLIKTDKKTVINAKIESAMFGNKSSQIKIGN